MRYYVLARRAGVLAAAAASGALLATPALADVTVSPTTAVQGSGENFTFHVTNTGTAAVGTVTLKIPSDTPVAEVYPLSIDDWAPKITMRKLSSPLPTIHDGIPADEVTDTITWIAMPGKSLAPGKSADLTIALGPLPTLSSMRFTITTLYQNGQAGPAMTPADVALTVATEEQQAALNAEHAGHEAATTAGAAGTDEQTQSEDEQFAQLANDATRGPSFWSIGGPLALVIAIGAGAFLLWRNRHRAEEGPEDETPGDGDSQEKPASTGEKASEKQPEEAKEEAEKAKEPVPAGKWSLKE